MYVFGIRSLTISHFVGVLLLLICAILHRVRYETITYKVRATNYTLNAIQNIEKN